MKQPNSWRIGKTTAERGYGHRWQEARRSYLRANPLCAMCNAEGRVEAAAVVDHIVPHRGDMAIFWDQDNWQSLCKRHHDSDKAAMERSGRVRSGADADGWPTDPKHPWNQPSKGKGA